MKANWIFFLALILVLIPSSLALTTYNPSSGTSSGGVTGTCPPGKFVQNITGVLQCATPSTGSQTPWTSNINGGNYDLSNVNNIYVNNNVGIGTNSPARKLEVNSGSTWQVARFTTTTGDGAVVEMGDGVNYGLFGIRTGGNGYFQTNSGIFAIEGGGGSHGTLLAASERIDTDAYIGTYTPATGGTTTEYPGSNSFTLSGTPITPNTVSGNDAWYGGFTDDGSGNLNTWGGTIGFLDYATGVYTDYSGDTINDITYTYGSPASSPIMLQSSGNIIAKGSNSLFGNTCPPAYWNNYGSACFNFDSSSGQGRFFFMDNAGHNALIGHDGGRFEMDNGDWVGIWMSEQGSYPRYFEMFANSGHSNYMHISEDTVLNNFDHNNFNGQMSIDSGNIHTDGSGNLWVNGKITSYGGYDPPYVMLDKTTQAQTLNRIKYEVPISKLGGLALWWNGTTLMGVSSPDNVTANIYAFQTTLIKNVVLPVANTTYSTSYYFDPIDGQAHQSTTITSTKWKIKNNYMLNTTDGNFYKIITSTNYNTTTNITTTITTYQLATRTQATSKVN